MALNSLVVSDAFKTSLAESFQYPENLLERYTYSATLKAYRTRLEKALNLFVTEEADTEIAFRDFGEGASKFERKKVRNLQELKEHLGIRVTPAAAAVAAAGAIQPGQTLTFQKRDPKCRFIFIYGNHSRARVRITRSMFVELLSFHQVMPNYLDFVFLFGQNSGPNDMRFSGFREQSCLRPPLNPSGQSSLGNSGRYYELSYNLKTVQLQNPDNEASWSVRQAGIYHRFDVVYGTTLWAVTKALSDNKHDLKERIEDITGPRGREEDRNFATTADCFRSTLAIHSLIIHWATESWRWYLQWLDENIEEQTQSSVHGTRDRNNKGRKWYTGQDLQRVQKLEESVNEVNMIVDGNMDVMQALSEHYENMIVSSSWPLPSSCAEPVHIFSKQVKNAIYDLKMQSSRTRALAKHTNERKNLILQYVQAQTAENMEDLTKSSYSVGISAQKEAISMRIITVVTLIYLPATFVSTFFSTDVVHYQNGGSGDVNSSGMTAPSTSFSLIAMVRWLQVSLPLTFITLVLAFWAYKWAKAREHRKNQEVLGSFGLV